ncbi:hypothetical protein ACHAWT_001987 [Skeletonema menzelii]|mmetsp:Transcript_21726/g.35837  ORF Transcript_21726/g.35837 Transcript_21726/m.35837 type:complete len:421 (-) Transcript_21726:341-1603(-)|eukprot:scaffold7_cov142-Skeletonema_menzelii.AAC.10
MTATFTCALRHQFTSAFTFSIKRSTQKRCLASYPRTVTAEDPIDVGEFAKSLGVRLTSCEKELLRKRLDINKDGFVTQSDLTAAGQRALEHRTARELCLQVIEEPTTPIASIGKSLIRIMDTVAVALFSVVGTQVAGDVGFNIVGCTLVGCIGGLGGRTINNLLYGNSAPLLRQLPGVFWTRQPHFLAVAIGSSLAMFFAWPQYCDYMSTHCLEEVIGKDKLEEDGSVGETAFVQACEKSEDFLKTIQIALLPKFQGKDLNELSATKLFRQIDLDGSGTIDSHELKMLVQERVRNSWEMYTIDTIALASISVAGVHGAIGMGVHPLVAAVSGVTMSLGGVMRDIICGRDILAATQSYALATGCGSAVYVLTRELALRGIPLLAITRIALSLGTTISLRYWEFVRGEPLLSPMHAKASSIF